MLVNFKQLEILRERITYIRETANRDSIESRQINLTLDELDALVLNELKRLVWERYLKAEEPRTRAQMSGRTVSILISEIGHDLDELATGWSQKEDALIKVGLHDARRDLEELEKLIEEVSV